MRRSIWGAVLGTIVVLGGLGALGYGAYQAGYRQGLIENGAEVVVPAFGPYPGFGLFFGLLFFFFLFSIIGRMFFWRRWRGGPKPWHHGDPSPMEERLADWHEKAHGEGRTYRSDHENSA